MTDTAYTGNAIPAPGFYGGRNVVDDEILYSTVGYVQKGVTLKPGQGVLLGGTFLAQDSATKQYVKTTTPGDVKGVLRKAVDTGSDANAKVFLGNILYGGAVKLAAVQAANSGVTLTSVLGAQVNAAAGFFRF
jgi:hypothetical protein